MPTKKKSNAFTLIELLVVIGIIALLISILLPALNKARQQANLVDCQSRLRQIGQVLSIYETENSGTIPLAEIDRTPAANDDDQETRYFWQFALGALINNDLFSTSDGLVHNLSKVFTDTDTITGFDYRWVCHYACNPRVFYYPGEYTFGTPPLTYDVFHDPLTIGRKITDIENVSDVFAVWDAPQEVDQYYNSYSVAQAIDAYGFYFTGLAMGNVNGISPQSNLAIWPNSAVGSPGVGDGSAEQKALNADGYSMNQGPNPPWVGFRFRHMNGTKLAALCLDGHVETRLAGSVMRSDIYTNVPGHS